MNEETWRMRADNASKRAAKLQIEMDILKEQLENERERADILSDKLSMLEGEE